MNLRNHFSSRTRFGFTLVELMVVVAIVSVLAAIAIPTYSKYVKKSRTSEATGNLGAIAIYEETFFSENDTYVTAIPNPSSVPNPSVSGGRLTPDENSTVGGGWNLLGRVLPDTAPLYFQYEVIAGQFGTGGSGDHVTGGTGNLEEWDDASAHSAGGSDCSVVGEGSGGLSGQSLNIPEDASSSWFFATAIGDQDGDQKCSLFVKVIDRPDLVVEQDIE